MSEAEEPPPRSEPPAGPPPLEAEEPLFLLPPRPLGPGKRLATAGLVLGSSAVMLGGCLAGPVVAIPLEPLLGPAAALAALSATCGLPCLAGLVLAWVVHGVHQHGRSARLLPGGVAFGHSPVGGTLRLRWEDVAGFRTVSDGVVLRLAGRQRGPGRWLSRWFGPKLACEGETMHRVVVLLEEKGILAEGAHE